MRLIFPSIKSKPVFTLDFSLAYVGVLFLAFSIAGTELLRLYPENKSEAIKIRILHTCFILALIFVTELLLKVR